MAESNPVAQRFLKSVWQDALLHGYTSNTALTEGSGHCFVHDADCRCVGPVHMCSAGLPCLPFSLMRSRAGTSQDTQEPEKHSAYDTVMVHFFEYLRVHSPLCVWVEEVLAFNNSSKKNGHSHLATFQSQLKECGYASHVLEMCHSVFIPQKRPRLFIIACKSEAGGQNGADWIAQEAVKILEEIAKFPTVSLWDVVDVESTMEQQYRDQVLHGIAAHE